jgi:hypothetical protein
MTTEQLTPTLRFAGDFTDQDAFEASGRGYLSHVMVELGEGRLYPLFFYDVVRLQQDLQEGAAQGRPFVADPGMIVVEEITLENMRRAIQQLGNEGFFDYLTPITRDDLSSNDPYQWPPKKREKCQSAPGRIE